MDSSTGALPQVARGTITAYHLLGQGDRIAVGVSGGADSVALLAFLCSLREELSLQLVVCHLNHCLRGVESDGDQEFVEALAAWYGLEFYLCSFDAVTEAAGAGLGVEEYSRNRRYAFFAQCAGENGWVATAHTLDDAVETVLFNLLRGTGVKGLRGIPYRRDNIVRPLRDCTRVQVEQYLQGLGQSWRTDSSNNSDDYSRNLLRHRVVPVLQQLNPALHTAMGRTMAQMEQQWELTEQLAREARERVSAGEHCLWREAFLQLPLPVGDLLLQQWLEQAGAAQSQRLLTRLRQRAQAGSGGVEVTRGVRFLADRQQLRLVWERESIPPFRVEIILPALGASTKFSLASGKILKICSFPPVNQEITEKFYNIDLKNLVKCDKIKEHVFAHNPQPGDTICLQGATHSLFARYRTGSRGYSAGEISAMTVVEDGDGILWAERLGCDEQRRAEARTGFCYSFEVLEETNP